MNCKFCNNPEIQRRIIYKGSKIFVFPTNIPIVVGHVLISPIRHVEKFEDLTTDEHEEMESIRIKICASLKKAFGATGFNFAWNEGVVAGQSVPHLHLHVLPRKKGDAGIYEYEPRKFLYRPGLRQESPDQELFNVANAIKKFLI